jgi:hypothetical protein
MRISSLLVLLVPALALAAACGGSSEPPATAAAPPASSTAPADTSAAPAASATPAPAASAAPADTATAPVASAAPAPSASAAPALPPVPAAPKPWADMTHEERLGVMKTAVFPNMKTAFQSFDSKDFADFTCKTCHGEAAVKAKKFKMPNAGLPKLDFKNQLKDDMAKHPDTVKFMHEVVVPQMVTMLGEKPFDMKTMTGFGCNGCHTAK